MSVLVDTNVLLRRTQPGHPHHEAAVASVERLLASGEPVYFAPRNIAEFWNVATRALDLLPDTPALYEEWKRLVVEHGVRGTQVHDARLVAGMNVHGVTRLLTFNATDFARYAIELLRPEAGLAQPQAERR